MSLLGKFVILTSLMCLLATVAISAHRTSTLVFVGIAISFVFLGVILLSLIAILLDWPTRRWRALLPFASCILAVVLLNPLSSLARKAVFAGILPKYQSIVQRVESGNIPATDAFTNIKQFVPNAPLAYSILAQKATNGAVIVMFFTESGFPALHSGYLYTSTGNPNSANEPIIEKVRNNWFFFSN